MTAVDVKLERLKLAISFMIADMCWVNNQDKCTSSEDRKNEKQKFQSSFIHPSSFVHFCKTFIHPGVNHSPG